MLSIKDLNVGDKVIVTRKRKDRLKGIVIQVTHYFIVIQLEHYRECFLQEQIMEKVED